MRRIKQISTPIPLTVILCGAIIKSQMVIGSSTFYPMRTSADGIIEGAKQIFISKSIQDATVVRIKVRFVRKLMRFPGFRGCCSRSSGLFPTSVLTDQHTGVLVYEPSTKIDRVHQYRSHMTMAEPQKPRRTLDPALVVPNAEQAWHNMRKTMPSHVGPARQYVTQAGVAAASAPILPLGSGLQLPTQLLASLGPPPPSAEARSAGTKYVEVGSYKKRSRARASDEASSAGSASGPSPTGSAKGSALIPATQVLMQAAPNEQFEDLEPTSRHIAHSSIGESMTKDGVLSDDDLSAATSVPAGVGSHRPSLQPELRQSDAEHAAEAPAFDTSASVRTRKWKFKRHDEEQGRVPPQGLGLGLTSGHDEEQESL